MLSNRQAPQGNSLFHGPDEGKDILCSQRVKCSRALTLKIHMKKFIKDLIKNMSG
jgi:hypothetical protein